MPEKVAISVSNLSKTFKVNHSGINSLKTLLVSKYKSQTQKLEVLRGISFDIPQGECCAIVGRNGAGKSTLLSLLSRIYNPTTGSIKIEGRVAPLLELGAGFHMELTGLENIMINAMIMGLTKKQVREKLDSIIEFAELRRFIDSPVRTYSSGMIARLGFSIAVHVDADILIVDEVLAVGDFDFRAKCANKIDELRAAGKTILLVSHSAEDIKRLADRCIWLQSGEIAMDGKPLEVLEAYNKRSESAVS